MAAKNKINIVGVCRFSMLGRGDWKAYRNQPDENLEQIYREKAVELFAPERLEARLATFEHLTLKSMAAQTDQDFTFIVLSSDRMPLPWRERLIELCAPIEQVVLRFLPPTHVAEAQLAMMEELSIPLADTLQFRLDDDDCVSKEFIRRARRHATGLWKNTMFGLSFSTNYYCVLDGPTEGVYHWPVPFFSAGASVRHPRNSVFEFGHFRIPDRLLAVTDPFFPNIVTHRGDNDTPRHEASVLRKRGMVPATPDELRKAVARHFDYLTEEGLALCGFDKFLATAPATPEPA
ncbi:MAG TPA: glycosyltransferase [Paracoccus sp. (in: a-proteobacteria)]|nr:glycosyltransferase [Paracoccus sp. (in: a-proteobacteria)]